MAKDLMSDAEIRRRKKLQSIASRTTGTLGLTSLGLYGASKLPGSRLMGKTPKLRRIASRIPSERFKDASLGTSTAGGALGGAASFNFAAYTSAESRKRKPQTVKKSDPFNIEKAGDWKTIHQREQTQRRDRKVQAASGSAAGAGAGLVAYGVREKGDTAAYQAGVKANQQVRDWAATRRGMNKLGIGAKASHTKVALAHAQTVKSTFRRLSTPGKAGLGMIAAGAAAGGAAKGQQTYNQHKINQRRRARVKKSMSAFGVVHD